MEDLKIKVNNLAKLAARVSSGFVDTIYLNEDDIFEVEFQLDNCLKALNNLSRFLDTLESDTSNNTVSTSSNSDEERDSSRKKHESNTAHGSGDMNTNNSFDEDGDTENKEHDPSNGQVEAECDQNDDNALDDNLIAEFMNDDDDDFENLDVSSENVEEDHALDGVEPPSQEHKRILKQHFGHHAFRPFQWAIISTVLREKRDQCVVMATGYGKSLCYQFPSVFTCRTSVVISPLISLMQDQVLSLKMVNIPATYLGSAQQNSSSVESKMMSGEYRIVYVTPEFVTQRDTLLKKLDKEVGIDLIAIDEAHCVSQWGHDFRSSYQQLGFLRDTLPNVPILAVTATATPGVRQDIARSLKLVNPKFTCTSFDRANLRFSVQVKSDLYSDLKEQMSRKSDGSYKFDGPTIIYCPTKKSVEDVLNTVRGLGVPCARYHASLSMSERAKAHEDFVSDKIECIVATVAFGMGIDKPDVRLVIHYGAPKDLESYYQEIGRAGRDGDPSACVAFYSSNDFNTNKAILSNQDIKNDQFLQYRLKMLQKMSGYLSSTECRRSLILKHFDKNAKSDLTGTDDCCDNCQRRKEAMQNQNNNDPAKSVMTFGEKFNFGEDAKLLLQSIELFRERYGLGAAVALLTGSSDKRAQMHNKSPLFGAGKHHTQKWWSTFGRMLTNEGFIAEQRVKDSFGCTVSFTDEGRRWLKTAKITEPVLELLPNQELLSLQKLPKTLTVSYEKKILPSVPTNTWLSSKQLSQFTAPARVVDSPEEKELQAKLYGELMKLRNVLAEGQSCAPYMVASNKNLLDLAKYRPNDLDNLAKLEDLPEVKQEKFGPKFIECVKKFCEDNKASYNRFPETEEVSPNIQTVTFDQTKFILLSETARNTYSLLEKQNLSLERACEMRGLKSGSLTSHMCQAIKLGLPVDIEKFGVTEKVKKIIIDTIRAPPINSDVTKKTPIKEVLPEDITWDQLNIVIAILERQFGFDDENDSKSAPDTSQPKLTRTLSDSDSQGKRKLPTWMGNSSKSSPAVKKQKSSLFKR